MKQVPYINEQEWRPAVYNGQPIKNMLISNYGFYRRLTKLGTPGQISRGTPSIAKEYGGRLRMYMVSCSFDKELPGKKTTHTTLNIDRISCSTFLGTNWEKGMEVDHLDRDVNNGFVGSGMNGYKDGNLRPCDHKTNMANRNVIPPRRSSKSPIAGAYAYKMKLQLGCQRIADLPRAYRNEYQRLVTAENRGKPAIPRPINLNDQKVKPGRKAK